MARRIRRGRRQCNPPRSLRAWTGASLIADMALAHGLQFPALDAGQQTALRNALGPMVALSNPLDYHTYIWRNTAAMTQAWSAMTGPGIDLTLSVVDYPRTDPTDWRCTVEAALATRAQTDRPFAVVASLPELMPADIAAELMEGGVVPMCGLSEALVAADAAARIGVPHLNALWPALEIAAGAVMTEARAKARLAAFGLDVPRHRAWRWMRWRKRQLVSMARSPSKAKGWRTRPKPGRYAWASRRGTRQMWRGGWARRPF